MGVPARCTRQEYTYNDGPASVDGALRWAGALHWGPCIGVLIFGFMVAPGVNVNPVSAWLIQITAQLCVLHPLSFGNALPLVAWTALARY